MQLGFLTHVAGEGSPARVYRDTLDLAVAAEELGSSSFWVAQHHAGSLEGLLPSPLTLLAAAATRTSTIRLGTAVVAAPLEDPWRLAEDAAVVDTLSGGRLELGVGAGADPDAAARAGLDHARRHRDCAAVVDEVRALLGGDALVPAAPGLRERMWWATGTASAVDAAARRGLGLISGRPADAPGAAVLADLDRYWALATAPRVVVSRTVGVDEDADAVVARLEADPAVTWATELVVQAQPARAGFDEQLAVLRRWAREIAPRLGRRPATRSRYATL
jgi:alkanesulfonate monooxygenase SsuD/methylene tetrahydromethanopterin reductase-like flavin-dependent oxidoreductase (luciferase family)